MNNKLPKAVLLLTLSAAATALYAQMPYIFEEIDVNHDGAISMSEAAVRTDLHADFAKADSNGNGSLSVDEYSAYMNKGQMAPEDVEIPEPGAAPVK
jgi:Ca2+-binding EF-hand superfamily protein